MTTKKPTQLQFNKSLATSINKWWAQNRGLSVNARPEKYVDASNNIHYKIVSDVQQIVSENKVVVKQ